MRGVVNLDDAHGYAHPRMVCASGMHMVRASLTTVNGEARVSSSASAMLSASSTSYVSGWKMPSAAGRCMQWKARLDVICRRSVPASRPCHGRTRGFAWVLRLLSIFKFRWHGSGNQVDLVVQPAHELDVNLLQALKEVLMSAEEASHACFKLFGIVFPMERVGTGRFAADFHLQNAQMKAIALKTIPTITKIPKNDSEDGKWERESRCMKLLWNVFFSRTVINYANSCNLKPLQWNRHHIHSSQQERTYKIGKAIECLGINIHIIFRHIQVPFSSKFWICQNFSDCKEDLPILNY